MPWQEQGRIAALVHRFNDSVDDPETIPEAICQGIAGAFGCGAVLVLGSELDPDSYPTAAVAHVDEDELEMIRTVLAGEPIHAGEGVTGRAISAGAPVLLADVEPAAVEAIVSPEHLEIVRRYPVYSVAVAPVRAGGLILGAITIFSNREDLRFDEVVLEELRVLADHAGLALRNGRLLASLREELRHRAALEAERREIEARMQRARHMESLGVLAAGVAHDFNNLLVGILGNASLALLELPEGARARSSVAAIEGAAREAADLTRQMLAYSGRGRFLVERLDLSRLVGELDHLLRAAVAPGAELVLELGEGLPEVEADATQLRQLVLELARNAAEANEGEGLVTVRTGVEELEVTEVAGYAEGLPGGRYVVLEVADDGPGVAPELRERVFDPFFSTREGARGLGLAAALGIVRGHGGGLRLLSEPGRGTRARALLPTAPDRVSGEAAPDRPLVLVADDEPTVRDVARKALELGGYRVITAEDGREAIELYEERREEIELVILDLTMPRVDGTTAFAELRRRDPDVRVLLCSGYSESEVVHRFAGRGLAGFLQKPWSAGELIRRVTEILA